MKKVCARWVSRPLIGKRRKNCSDLCHEAILRELRWLLLPNPCSRPDLASSDFHWVGLFTDPLRGRKFGCESELNEVIKGMSKRMALD